MMDQFIPNQYIIKQSTSIFITQTSNRNSINIKEKILWIRTKNLYSFNQPSPYLKLKKYQQSQNVYWNLPSNSFDLIKKLLLKKTAMTNVLRYLTILTLVFSLMHNANSGMVYEPVSVEVDQIISSIDHLDQQHTNKNIKKIIVERMNRNSKEPLCPVAQPMSLEQLSSGSVQIQNSAQSYSSSQSYGFNFQRELQNIDKSVASVSMSSFSTQIGTSISFSIDKVKTSTTGFSFLFSSAVNSAWTNMKLSFIVANRPDIEIVSVTYNASNNRPGSITYDLKKDWSQGGKIQMVSFLTDFSGMSEGESIGFWITGHRIVNRKVIIDFESEKLTKINNLGLDVVVFDPTSSTLRFQHRQTTDTFLFGTQIGYLPQPLKYQQRMQMFGLTSFVVSTNIQLTLFSSFEQGDNHRVIKYGLMNEGCSFNYLSLSYLMISYNPCGFCKGTYYIFENKCLEKCPFGTRPTAEGTCIKIQCPEGTYLHVDNTCRGCAQDEYLVGKQCIKICDPVKKLVYFQGVCVCIQGYFNISGNCGICPSGTNYDSAFQKCIPICQQNQRYDSGVRGCVCIDGWVYIGNRCGRCQQGQKYDSAGRRCVNICSRLEQYINGECICLNGYNRMLDGTCARCPAGTNYDSVSLNCVKICGINEIFIGGKCVCKPSYVIIDGKCGNCQSGWIYNSVLRNCRQPCSEYQLYDRQKDLCYCKQTFIQVLGECRCPLNAKYNVQSDRCECNGGYRLEKGNVYRCVGICNENEVYLNGECVCVNGYYLIRGSCRQCPPNMSYNANFGICHTPCNLNEQYSINLERCVCQNGYYLINGICGQCPSNTVYDRISGSCRVPCGVNQIYDVNLNRCVCDSGYYLINNRCQLCPTGTVYDAQTASCRVICRSNEQYDSSLSRCVCINGYFLIDGACGQCPSNSVYDRSTGTCRVPCGVNQRYDINLNRCVCVSGYYLINSRCQLCPTGTVYNSQTGSCRIICQTNEQYDSRLSKCVCLSGYYLINGVCGQCPSNTVYDRTSGSCRVPCGVNQRYDVNLDRCVCVSGYYLINSRCQVCPTGTVYDAQTGSCRVICRSNEYYDISKSKCVCNAGYYFINGFCSQCQPQEVYDASWMRCVSRCPNPRQIYNPSLQRCVCTSNYYLVNGNCQLCPVGQFYFTPEGGLGKCFNNCPFKQYFNPLTIQCECKQGYYNISGVCDICPSDQTYEPFSQKCIHKCPPFMMYNLLRGECVCVDGYGLKNGQCMDCGPCSQINLFNYQCECAPTYLLIDGICGVCPIGAKYNSFTHKCEISCPQYAHYDELAGQCVCSKGYHLDLINNICLVDCPPSQHYLNGQCVCVNPNQVMHKGICVQILKCPPNSYFHLESYCCLCNNGFRMEMFSCVPIIACGPNSHNYNGMCNCNTGYYLINSQCVTCSSSEVFNGVECVCINGYNRNNQGHCVKITVPVCGRDQVYSYQQKQCVCIKGYQYIMGKCCLVPNCPAYAHWNGVSCICQSGYLLEHGICKPVHKPIPSCPMNSVFNGVSCACQQGFYPIKPGHCGSCPYGSSWNGFSCTNKKTCSSGSVISPFNSDCIPVSELCGPGAKWNGATCCCMPGYNLIGKTCIKCPKGTTFDGKTCSYFSTPVSPCGSNQLHVNGRCECSNGFYSINSLCTQCPSYSKWNGVYCQTNNTNVRQWCMGRPFTVQTSFGCECQKGYFNLDGQCVRY